jgi:hypothetical protein
MMILIFYCLPVLNLINVAECVPEAVPTSKHKTLILQDFNEIHGDPRRFPSPAPIPSIA